MQQEREKYPRPKGDRRLRARARPGASDRRGETRYAGGFPVRIYVGAGEDERVYRAIARDVSDGGMLLENVDIPAGETRIRLEFDLPHEAMPEEFGHSAYALAAEIRHRGAGGGIGVAFEESLSARLAVSTWYWLRVGAILGIFLAVSFILLVKLENFYFFWFDVPVFLYSLTVGAYLLSRFLFALCYRPPRPRADLPAVSVIVPGFNEEEHIERTLVDALESDYPAQKLQVVTVNDGSSDGTLETMQRVRRRYPELVIVDLGRNCGKRAALAAGAKVAAGEIVVFVDSDSFLQPDAVRNLMNGLADPEVAAVTGHCEVENIWTNFLTRMQAVRYYISFRIMKAAESVFDSVTCLSGPIAAYRREILLGVVNAWVGQTFLGRPATFGDDRSLTNLILRDHKVIYDSTARVSTIVPGSYRTFFRQQVRWKRSWFRESVLAARFLWRKPPLMSISFYLGVILPILAPAIVFRALVLVPLLEHGSPLMYLLGILMMSTLMSSTYLLVKRSRLWVYGIPFCFFYMFVLVWQLPYAICTFWASHWGTRG